MDRPLNQSLSMRSIYALQHFERGIGRPLDEEERCLHRWCEAVLLQLDAKQEVE